MLSATHFCGGALILIHIGLPKTATTFLQKLIFSRAVPSPGNYLHHTTAAGWLVCGGLKAMARSPEPGARIIATGLAAALRSYDATKTTIISNENISIDSARFWAGNHWTPSGLVSRLAMLKERLPDRCRVVIGTRSPDHWLASRYAQSSKSLGDFSQDDFDRRAKAIAHSATGTCYDWLDSRMVQKCFADILGEENVFIYAMESLKSDPETVLGEMGEFAKLDFLSPFYSARDQGERMVRNRRSLNSGSWRLHSGQRLVLTPETSRMLLDRFASHERQ